MTTFKKLNGNELVNEKFELKSYFKTLNLNEARLMFRIRSKMVKYVKMNFPSDPTYKREQWTCPDCPLIDTQSHIILTCPKYDNLRANLNLKNDDDLVKLFQEVMKSREKDDN